MGERKDSLSLKTKRLRSISKQNMNNEIQFILYQLPDEEGRVQVVIKDETIWATQKAMAQLFGVGVPAISKHLKNIFEEGELPEISVVSKMEITASDGKDYLTSFYSLDAIIAVGYRVSSARATKFRIWTTHQGNYLKVPSRLHCLINN
jgi:hypothetical protein